VQSRSTLSGVDTDCRAGRQRELVLEHDIIQNSPFDHEVEYRARRGPEDGGGGTGDSVRLASDFWIASNN
jgi:hypothetical protein